MSDEMDVTRGTGNVFADFRDPDAATKQLKAQMAADLIATLNMRGLSVRAAAREAQVDPSDIQRIRNADLSRFTLDRLVRIAHRLGRRVDMTIKAGQSEAA